MNPISRQAERMNAQQEKGICRLCARKAKPGRGLCPAHIEKQNRRRAKSYWTRHDLGLCVTPGCTGAPGEFVRCGPCRKVIANYHRRNRSGVNNGKSETEDVS